MSPVAEPETLAEHVKTAGHFETVDIGRVLASKTNPRKHYDEQALDELTASIKSKGLIQPLVVRPHGTIPGKFEIVAGERRWRASKRAGLQQLPVIVRTYTDDEVLEAQLEENIHRDDLTALEQAAGYRALIASNPTKHSADSIAVRIGKSPAWVWDRLKLNDLVPEAKKLLEEEYLSTGHAILIARLKPADQQRIIAVDDDRPNRGAGLWRDDAGFTWDESDPANGGKVRPNKWQGLKTCSVRELEAYIRDHVRFDVKHAATAAPLEFEEVAERVDAAAAQPGRGKKVIAITFDHYVQPEARAEDERTYGPRSFKLADGQKHVEAYSRKKYFAHTCEHAVLGVVAAGDRYGEALQVCIARDKCEVHWKKAIGEKRKTQQLRDSGQAAKAKKSEADRREAEERRRRAEEQREAAERKAWQQAAQEILEALAEKVTAAKPSVIGPQAMRGLEARNVKEAVAALGTPRTYEDYLRTLVFVRAVEMANSSYWGPRNLPTFAKAFGLNIAPIVQKHRAAAATPAKAGKKR